MTDNPSKVLCVDDELNVLRSLQRTFMDEDFQVLTAPDASEGLRLLAEEPEIRVVLSDFRMPGMDGVAFLRQVSERWPDKIRMVISGYADAGSVIAAVNEGKIYKFIPKPWEPDELCFTVRQALELHNLQESNRLLNFSLQESNRELIKLNRKLADLLRQRTDTVKFQGKALEAVRFIMDALPVGMLGIDDQGEVVQCNELGARLLGVRKGELLLHGVPDVLPPSLVEFVGRIRPGGGLVQEKLAGIGAAGVKALGVYMQSDDGRQQGIIVVLEEITKV